MNKYSLLPETSPSRLRMYIREELKAAASDDPLDTCFGAHLERIADYQRALLELREVE